MACHLPYTTRYFKLCLSTHSLGNTKKHFLNNSLLFIPFVFIYIVTSATQADETKLTSTIKLFTDTLVDSCVVHVNNGRTSVTIQKESKKKNNILKIDFDDKTYTTFEVCFKSGKSFNFTNHRSSGFIRFRIKGMFGGEQCFIGVADDNRKLKYRTEVKYHNTDFFMITQEWQEVVCPLSGFSCEGERWYEDQKISEYSIIDWSKISLIKFSTAKEMNYGRSNDRIATIFIDDLELITDPSIKPVLRQFTPWRFEPKIITGPLRLFADTSNVFFSWIDTSLSPKSSVYTYGDPTDYAIFSPVDKEHAAVFATFQNDKEWSGVTIYRNMAGSIDVSPWLKSGGIEFYVKGAHGGENFHIGVLDDESDGIDKRIQSKLFSKSFIKVTTEWQRVCIPFSSFGSTGRWWNSDAHYEVVGTLDWSKISELRFSVDQFANRPIIQKENEPVSLYFSNIRFLKKSEVQSNSSFWESFSSSEPDRLIDNFNTFDVSNIKKNLDPTSVMSFGTAENPLDRSNAINMNYKIGSWGSAAISFPEANKLQRNWSSHNAITFDFYSSDKNQTCMLMLIDSGSEAWSAHFISGEGWQKITVPFSRFKQFEWWQPDDAVLNGQMDLQAVKSFDWRPGSVGKKGNIIIDNLSITNFSGESITTTESIHINQSGYLPGFFKKFSVTDKRAFSFLLKNSDDNVVLMDSLSNGTFWEPSGQFVKTGEFSGISQPGNYTLTIQETGETVPILIKDTLRDILRDALRAFYYQRASIDHSEPFAGKFHHSKGHPDTAVTFHQTTNKSGTTDVRGGWYDAGDYGKYIVNAGISCFRLLSLYELYPGLFGDNLKIPESGNKIDDLLDEVRYELEWFKRMQDTDGGVFFKVGTLEWDGFVMPDKSKLSRYVIGKSTTSTLNFSASMAMAGRIFRNIDKKFSQDCTKRAVAAWNWAIQNPSVSQPSEVGGTGAYGDQYYNDEFFWAASELFTTTKKAVYKKCLKRFEDESASISPYEWKDVGLCGYLTLMTHFTENEVDAVRNGTIIIRNLADSIVSKVDKTPFGTPSQLFVWGSNDYMLNHAVVCCYAYKMTGKRKYLNTVIDIVSYIFGNNPTGYSFVTGYGTRSPLQPHHRIMGSDGIDEPYPGFLVGGPNASREDEISEEAGVYYPYKQPARAYVDAVAAYASNEICINWNAVLVFVLGFVEMNK